MRFKGKKIVNFGENVRFKAENYYIPESEDELLKILRENKNNKIKVIGAKHSWSNIFKCKHAIVDMSKFNTLKFYDGSTPSIVEFGAGIQIKHALKKLHKLSNFTFPSVGLITEQTVAGAISTSTHGCGKNSLSHYVQEIRFAAYNNQTGEPEIFTVNSGEELRAARCSIGCMGIIISVKLEVIPKYYIAESKGVFDSIEGTLKDEEQYPLQQTYLIPYYWAYIVQRRQIVEADAYKLGTRLLYYRLYWLLISDILFHLNIKFINMISGNSNKLFSFFYSSVFPYLVIDPNGVVDKSHRQLVMKNQLFKHFEIELFVKKSNFPKTMSLVEDLLKVAAGTESEVSTNTFEQLKKIGLHDKLNELKGKHVHHYPICIRKVLPDDAMMSTCSSDKESYYSVSFICYRKDRIGFKFFADFLTEATFKLFNARLHWGKHFSHDREKVSVLYPELGKFREICRKYDPSGVFRNKFAEAIIFEEEDNTDGHNSKT
jgi:D-arabinono-1,4-lactone oxidase/FAD binding domain